VEARKVRGSYAKGRSRREEILQVALEVFAAEGYRGGSLLAVSRRVGLTDAGILHHFPSKEHLLMAVLELCEAEDRAWVRAMTAASGADGTPVMPWPDRLLEAGRRIISRPEVAHLEATLAAESVHPDHPAHAWFRDRQRRLRREIADGMRVEHDLGHLPPGTDPDLAAAHLLAVLAGLKNQWLLDPGGLDPVAALADYLAPYRAALPAPKPGHH
jgi:AcrR family transcriptional regulator